MKRPIRAIALSSMTAGFTTAGTWTAAASELAQEGFAREGFAYPQVWALPLVMLAVFGALGRSLTKELYRRR